MLLRNVIPLSLGILAKNKVHTLIKRNTPHRIQRKKLASVEVMPLVKRFYEGEQRTANGNTHLGTLKLKSGQQEDGFVDITFQINIKGELSAKTIERETKKNGRNCD